MISHNGDNVLVLGVRGDFDDCQNLVKTLMALETSNRVMLNELGATFNTANSINWGRILFQVPGANPTIVECTTTYIQH
jgi:threonine synthase